jgi:hypothetical protein
MSEQMPTLEALRRKQQAGYRFEVVCYKLRQNDRVIVRKLSYNQATQIAEALQRRHNDRYPLRTCWTRRYYSARLSSIL